MNDPPQSDFMLNHSHAHSNITGKPRVIDDPAVHAMAKKENREPAQILIAWVAHKGYSVIPKSVTPSRIESNFSEP